MRERSRLAALISLVAAVGLVGPRSIAESSLPLEFDRQLASLPVVDEIDTARQVPVHEYPETVSQVVQILGRPARTIAPAETPGVIAWVIGRGKGLKPGMPYVLEVEYPDDVPRSIFVANRGADLVRGFATGTAVGDARQQYVQPSIESLDYPQTGRWQTYRTVFFLHDRFQGLNAQRDSQPGGRPFGPADGFHVIVFQTKRLNDPRSQGAAIGRLRLRVVPDLAALDPKVELPPAGLPRRRIFVREEMADEVIQAREVNNRGVTDPLQWLLFKAKLYRLLAINTFAKDLLEFGFNQGWESGDLRWVNNAQPPMTDLWDRAVPRISQEGLDLLPYYEYKGAIGLKEASPASLGWQRRAEKLYHNLPNTRYTPVWWTEDHNADLTDPDTLSDARRLLDRTVIAHKGKAHFAGAWFRVRDNHLPMSFSEAAISRFRAALASDALAKTASRRELITSYEGDRKLYDRYYAWWLEQRARFFEQLAQHLAKGLNDNQVRLLLTPWTTEQIPMLRDPASGANGHPIQIVTDDPPWWDAFARRLPASGWFRWALVPTAFDQVVRSNAYGLSLSFRERITPAPERAEHDHSAPIADPLNYQASPRVMLTYPMGRLFTVARANVIEPYRTRAGLAVVRHYTLNEDNHDRTKGKSDLPFDGQVGYVCVDTDRAGSHVRLLEARAVAEADPTHLGYLCASSFSTGFPGHVRQFNAAFLAVPALPSRIVTDAANDPEVVVREIPTPHHGRYYLVVNTSMHPKSGVIVHLQGQGAIRDLLEHRELSTTSLRLDMFSAELRSYHIRLP
jgi:hypothetical protein